MPVNYQTAIECGETIIGATPDQQPSADGAER